MIDQQTIGRILDATNIVEVVSDFVTLRKRGVNYVGLCPFHDDSSPSLYVSPAKNICKCFACGEGGTAVHFIMKHEQLGYYDALRYLARKYNIEIQERELTEQEKQIKNDRESMLIVNEWAQKYFTNQLYQTIEGKAIGLRYFAERGFREDTIRKFQLGYSPDGRDALYQAALKKGFKKEYLEKTGLVFKHEDGKVCDRFWGRVIFPIHTLSGKVIAFGGRILKKNEKTAKYLNSPESTLYHKSNELYGIYFAKKAIVKADRCFLVEGYTDVISMHQAGIENVVASSGTSLTGGQIRMIHRFTNNITVLYDGDAAGIKAAVRGIDLLLEAKMNVKVVLLPDGEDPDSFARNHNASQFAEYIKQHETDFIHFKTRLLLDEAGNDPIKRATLISDIIKTVAIIPDNIARTIYIRECSAMMEIDEQVLLNEVNKIRLTHEASPQVDSPSVQLPTTPPPPANVGQQSSEAVTGGKPTDTVERTVEPTVDQTLVRHSPFEVYEVALLRYIVRYGEQILFQYTDEETQELVDIRVAEYIRDELEQDELTFYNPFYKKMMEEAADLCRTEGFVAHRHFLYDPNPEVSRIAADLMGEKYVLSKYHTKYKTLETEETQLPHFVLYDLFAFKDAYVLHQIKEVQSQIKKAQTEGDFNRVLELMKQLTHLNEIKNVLNKELGERIVLKGGVL